ncbi:MAG: c-type cytochrome [Gammaproteobacteria bacterium]
MRRFISWGAKLLPVVGLLTAALIPAYVWSAEAGKSSASGTKMQASPEAGAKIFNEGKGEAPPCMSCHGEQGLGDDNMGTPRLAGQGFVYLRKQLHDFATDKRTDTTMGVMNGIAKALSEQDRLDVASHEFSINQPSFASASNMQEIKTGGAVPVGIRHEGKGIVLYGIPKQGVPACSSCHQFNGRGAAPIYPMIGGQRYVYLVNQLNKWRDGSRENDMLGQMRAVAKNMTDADIHNVSAYLTSAPDRTLGNPERPHEYTPRVAAAEHAK